MIFLVKFSNNLSISNIIEIFFGLNSLLELKYVVVIKRVLVLISPNSDLLVNRRLLFLIVVGNYIQFLHQIRYYQEYL